MNPLCDAGVYRYEADFAVPVHPGVEWVPLCTLGKPRYTNVEIAAMAGLSPEEKRARIGNLYEAVQLFQASGFQGVLDNVNHYPAENELWQTHTAPLAAIEANEGCCATDTNWLAYLLAGKYDGMDSFCYANEDGNGHITTCIRQAGCWYFIDMMMCRSDSQAFLAPEEGDLSALLAGEWSGMLYRCLDPLDFCRFHMERCRAKGRPVPFCFYLRAAVTATGLRIREDGVTFLLPRQDRPCVLYVDEHSHGRVEIVDLPELE